MMLPKPDFGDLYKFRVSIGIALIIATSAMIGFFLRQAFDPLTRHIRFPTRVPVIHGN